MIWVPRGKGRDSCISLVWPQASGKQVLKRSPLWAGVHEGSGRKLRITTRRDHEFLMALYEDGKQILPNRIDVCGATTD